MHLISGFIEQSNAYPERMALLKDGLTCSYGELAVQVKKIASAVNYRAVTIQRVAIALDRGIEAATAILGVLYAGACYIPLDVKNPPDRLTFIIEDADVQCVIGKGTCPSWLQDKSQWLDISQIQSISSLTQPVSVNAETIAAILYTSGSTGSPKGVALSHRAMLNFSQWANRTFLVTKVDRVASLAPFHFDLSVFDLFTSLSAGASVNFIPARLALSPSRLSAWLSDNQISIWYTVPSLLSFMAFKGALETTPLPNLKKVLFAGEVFPTPHLIKLAKLLPNTELFNLYGPTETNVCCYWPVDKTRLIPDQPIPIGAPACGVTLKIDDATGELLAKGANNLSGYWQQGSLQPAILKNGWYATGDRVSTNKYGEYNYHGRLDRMLKCSGYRVEPAEIEATINQLPGVKQSVVLGINDSSSGQRLAAAIVLQTNYKLADIVKPLKQKLPAYMQPCKFIVFSALPQLANGKVDYRSLEQTFIHPGEEARHSPTDQNEVI